jgi:hypothetical protein
MDVSPYIIDHLWFISLEYHGLILMHISIDVRIIMGILWEL